MSVTHLTEGGAVHCMSGQVELRWTADPPTGAAIEVSRADGEAQQTLERQRGSAGPPDAGTSTIIPRPTVPLQVAARSVGAPTFPDGTRIRFRAVIGSGESADHVDFSDKDVSGLARCDLLRVEPAPAGLLVRYIRTTPRAAEPAAGHGADGHGAAGQASPPARAALYAARRCLGTERLPDAERFALGVAVDRSASMAPHMRSGLVDAVLAALAGVNAAAGAAPEVPVWDATRPEEEAAVLTASDAGRHGRGWLEGNQPASAAGYLAPAVSARARLLRPPAVFYLVTDAPPADLADLPGALPPPDGGAAVTLHLIVLAVSELDFRGNARPGPPDLEQDPLAVLLPLARHGVAVTVVNPEVTPPLAEALVRNESLAEHLADSLLGAAGAAERGRP